jgi:hypothetical protein
MLQSLRQADAQPFVEEAVMQVSDWGFSLSDIQMQKKEDQGLFELIMSLFSRTDESGWDFWAQYTHGRFVICLLEITVDFELRWHIRVQLQLLQLYGYFSLISS